MIFFVEYVGMIFFIVEYVGMMMTMLAGFAASRDRGEGSEAKKTARRVLDSPLLGEDNDSLVQGKP